MSHFSVKVTYNDGRPARDVGVIVYYDGFMAGFEEKRTHSDGWVKFHNFENKSGTIWVHGQKMGSHSLSDGKTYSFTI